MEQLLNFISKLFGLINVKFQVFFKLIILDPKLSELIKNRFMTELVSVAKDLNNF